MIIKESAENYLEAILMLKNKNGYVRSIDVAHHLNFTKPSVSVAMKSFREEGYVTVDTDGNIYYSPSLEGNIQPNTDNQRDYHWN